MKVKLVQKVPSVRVTLTAEEAADLAGMLLGAIDFVNNEFVNNLWDALLAATREAGVDEDDIPVYVIDGGSDLYRKQEQE
jgi:hypothetical protein